MTPFLSELYEHPLKSARGNLLVEARVEAEGLSRDRRFLAHTADGTFVSGRSHPKMVLIRALWDGEVLTLEAPNQPALSLRPTAVQASSVAVWKDRFPAWDQGEEAAAWLSAFLGDDLRLAWLGESNRPLRWDPLRRVTFADAAPLLGLGRASVAELSSRVGEALTVRRFRPNLVFGGTAPFDEDRWLRFRVGEVEFLNLDGCGRCEFTTVDPETGTKHPANQPVATLETFRETDTGIYFGMNLMPLNGGTIRVGDPVTVVETRTPLVFGPFAGYPEPAGRASWPEAPVELVCTGAAEETPGVKTFSFRPAGETVLGWEPGQYVTLKLDTPGGPLRRSYTLSSARQLQITVRRQDEGRGSGWLHQHLAVGTRVTAETLGGRFTLRDHPWPSYLFLGAGTGVTPLIALLERIADEDLPVPVAFHQSVRTDADRLFAGRLRELQARLGGRLTWKVRVTAKEGRLDHRGLTTFCPDLRDRVALVCGPEGYRSAVRSLLTGAGFKVDRRYREELFGEAALPVPEDAAPGLFTFARTGKAVPHDGRTTVLQLAERSGVDLPSSCRSGDCGTCRVKTSSGEWCLACQTFPRGDESYDL